MITKYSTFADGKCACDLYGLSTDAKPVDVCNASTFYEMDTKKLYMFDEEHARWIEQ